VDVKSPFLVERGKFLPCRIAGEKVMEPGVVQVFGRHVKYPFLWKSIPRLQAWLFFFRYSCFITAVLPWYSVVLP
jgi:hypothetical protein